MTCVFSGKLTDSQKKIKGKFEIPNLSEENEPSEIDVSKDNFTKMLHFCALFHLSGVTAFSFAKFYQHGFFSCFFFN